MSNVLIGIIGVILFIGLALAGALFLGPRFQQSTQASRASAAVQATAQVASAMNMYRAVEGTDYAGTGFDDLVTAGYLKAVPSNPTGTGDFDVGSVSDGNGSSRPVVLMRLGTDAEAVCKEINKQTSGNESIPVGEAGRQSGCYAGRGTWSVYTAI